MAREADALETSIRVEVPQDQAFAAFVDRLGTWWPQQFTFSEERFETAVIEPRAGLRWFERDTDGEEHEWGEVRVWEPPERILLSWQIGPDRTQEEPDRASEIEVRFAEEGPAATRVTLTHRHFGRHGEGGDQMRDGMASEQGWPEIGRASCRERVEGSVVAGA